jgi:serine/threonine-protein kinase
MKSYAGRYEIRALLGQGAYATVYRAQDSELGEEVALKVLRQTFASQPAVVELFRREARLARRITHRNVARVFDIGEHDGERFLTMEFIDGEAASELLSRVGQRGEKLPLAQVFAIVQQVCAGLSAAHAAGVLHRDLKPGNILLSRDGRAVLTDFGIARSLAPLTEAAPSMSISGTPAYMSPEQFNTPQPVDHRTDLYSLGVVLFELLTGARPFYGQSWMDVALKRMVEPPPDPRSLRSDIPELAAQLTLRCLAVQAKDRYNSAEEVAEVLSRLRQLGAAAEAPAVMVSSDSVEEATLFLELAELKRLNARSPLPSPRTKTLAVLPIRGQGSEADLYLLDGLTELLIDQLGAVRGLRVRSRGAVLHLRDDSRDVRAIGNELGVQIVLRGELQIDRQQPGGLATLSIRLYTVEHGLIFLPRTVTAKVEDLAAACAQLTAAVAEGLTVPLPNGAPSPSKSYAADLYLQARFHYHRGDRLSIGKSIELFEQALAIEPNDSYLLTGYAMACARLWFYGENEAGTHARAAAARAVAVAPRRGESHLSLAIVHFHSAEPAHAASELRLALAYHPNLAEAHELFGRLLIESGPLAEGIAHLELALKQDPSLRRARLELWRARALEGTESRVESLLDLQSSQGHAPLSDEDPLAHSVWISRARTLLWRRDIEGAKKALQRPVLASPHLRRARQFLEVAARVAPPEPKEVLGPKFLSAQSSLRGRSFYYQIGVEFYCLQEAIDQALHALALSIAEGLFDLMWLERCPLLEKLRNDPRTAFLHTIIAHRANAVHEALGWKEILPAHLVQ